LDRLDQINKIKGFCGPTSLSKSDPRRTRRSQRAGWRTGWHKRWRTKPRVPKSLTPLTTLTGEPLPGRGKPGRGRRQPDGRIRDNGDSRERALQSGRSGLFQPAASPAQNGLRHAGQDLPAIRAFAYLQRRPGGWLATTRFGNPGSCEPADALWSKTRSRSTSGPWSGRRHPGWDPRRGRSGPGSEKQHDAFAGQGELRYTGFTPQ
jgi:hypothetical protein